MALNYNITRAAVRLDQKQELIGAVYAATAADETTWLEWKSARLVLPGPHGFFTVARAVLGFANRMPDQAQRFAQGHAYVLVGVEPDAIDGVTPFDSVELHRELDAYLGKNGPLYQATFVPVDIGHGLVHVLLVDVEPPQWGDPIYPLRKGYEKVTAPAIFVRYPGKTERAAVEDIDALNERARRRRQEVQLSLNAIGGLPIRTIAAGESDQAAWLTMEKSALEPDPKTIKKPREYVSEPKAADSSALAGMGLMEIADIQKRKQEGEKVTAEEERALAEFQRVGTEVANTLMYAFTKTEPRTLDEYRDEVDDYITQCRRALPKAIRRGAAAHLAPLRLRLHNRTEMNLSAIEVIIYIPGDVEAVLPRRRAVAVNDSFVSLPRRPQLYGTAKQKSPLMSTLGGFARVPVASRSMQIPVASTRVIDPHKPTIVNGGSSRITFPIGDLRPGQHADLVPMVVLAHAPAPEKIIATWSATCTNFDGTVTGQIDLSTAGPVLSIEELITEPEGWRSSNNLRS